MLKKKIISACLFLFWLHFPAFSQNSDRYPLRFSQFFLSYLLLNPASSAGEGERLSLNAGQQFYSGPLNIIRTSFAAAHLTLPSGKLKSQGVGLQFISDKEGELLSYTRAYLHYAVMLPLSSEWKLSSGIRAGLVHFFAEQTASSRVLSSTAPDMSAGMELGRKDLRIGLSGEQLLKSRLPADLEMLRLPSLFNVYVANPFRLGTELGLFTTGMIRMKTSGFLDGDLAANLIIKEKVFAGPGYGTSHGLSFHLGIKNLGLLQGKLDAAFFYNSAVLGALYINIQTFEISLSYRFLSKKEE